MRRTPLLAILTTVVLFGSAFPITKFAMKGYPPEQLVLCRFLLASLGLAVCAAAQRVRLPDPADLPRVVVCGLMLVMGYHLAFTFGQRLVSVSAASILANTGPLWTVLASTVFLGERPRSALWTGLLVSLLGASVLAIGKGGAVSSGWGSWLMLGAACLQGCGFVVQRPLAAKYGALSITTATVWAGTAVLFMLFGRDTPDVVSRADPASTAAVVILAIGSSTLGMLSWAYVLARMPASSAAPFLLLIPVIATVVALVWLHEVPSLITLVGGAVTLAGVALSQRSTAQPVLVDVANPAAST